MNNEERELLELAAKAAEKPGQWDGAVFVLDSPSPSECSAWNPLDDDGAALRLAVKLNMALLVMHFDCMHDHEYVRVTWDGYDNIERSIQEDGSDPYIATRRAIVRAAAELGKSVDPLRSGQ